MTGRAAHGVSVDLCFLRPATTGGRPLLPTGNPIDNIGPGAGHLSFVPATLITAGAPAALADAREFGLKGSEEPAEFQPHVADLIAPRHSAALRMGLMSASTPLGGAVKVGVVAAPRSYRTTNGATIRADQYDLAVRTVSMHTGHPVVGLPSAFAIAAAATVPGSLIARHVAGRPQRSRIRLGTPAGVLTASLNLDAADAQYAVGFPRAAWSIVSAQLYVATSQHTIDAHDSTGLAKRR